MNLAYLHLLLNHLPVVGSIFALFLLLIGIVRRSLELQKAALIAFMLIALISIPTFLTGEPAEKIVTNVPGISLRTVHNHEEAAEVSFWGIQALGAFAFIGLWLYRSSAAMPKWFLGASLALALTVGVMMAWTANLGGQIRHSEIYAGAGVQPDHEHEPGEGD
jgi:uncharacterized membrane protein